MFATALVAARRRRLRAAVTHYAAHRAGMLGRLGIADGPDVVADLRRAWRSERNRCAAGHWSASPNRLAGLWQAMVAERALRLATRRSAIRSAA